MNTQISGELCAVMLKRMITVPINGRAPISSDGRTETKGAIAKQTTGAMTLSCARRYAQFIHLHTVCDQVRAQLASDGGIIRVRIISVHFFPNLARVAVVESHVEGDISFSSARSQRSVPTKTRDARREISGGMQTGIKTWLTGT